MSSVTDRTTADRPRPRPRRGGWGAVVASGVAALALVAAGSVAVLALRDRLPDPVAIHWGTDGPDGFASLTGALYVVGGTVLGMTLLLAALAALVHRSARHQVGGLATGVAVFVALVGYGSVLGQAGLASADEAAVPGPWIGGGVVLGLLAGYAVVRHAAPEPGAGRQPVPPEAPRLDAPATTRVSWVGTLPVARPALVVVVLAAVAPTVYLAMTLDPWLWVVSLLLLGLVVVMTTGTVAVDRSGVRVRSLGTVRLLRVPLEEITSAEATSVRPLAQYGGWGWRMGRDGSRGLVTAGGPALRIHRAGMPDTVVSLADPQRAAAVLNTLVEGAARR